MNTLEELEYLVQYERTDIPPTKEARFGWSMYTAEKIILFLGERNLQMIFCLENKDDAKKILRSKITSMLTAKKENVQPSTNGK